MNNNLVYIYIYDFVDTIFKRCAKIQNINYETQYIRFLCHLFYFSFFSRSVLLIKKIFAMYYIGYKTYYLHRRYYHRTKV